MTVVCSRAPLFLLLALLLAAHLGAADTDAVDNAIRGRSEYLILVRAERDRGQPKR